MENALKSIIQYFRQHPPKRFEVLALIGFVLFIYIFYPYGGSRNSDPVKPPSSVKPIPPLGSIPATQPAETMATTSSNKSPAELAKEAEFTVKSVHELGLFDPAADGADPSWSLPAELSTVEIQSMVSDVERLISDNARLVKRQQDFIEKIGNISSADVQNAMWGKLVAKNFRDKQLPLDWYDVCKDHVGPIGIFGAIPRYAELFGPQLVLGMRINTIKFNLLGGHANVGDVLFLKCFKSWVNYELQKLDRLEPLYDSTLKRLRAEFNNPKWIQGQSEPPAGHTSEAQKNSPTPPASKRPVEPDWFRDNSR